MSFEEDYILIIDAAFGRINDKLSSIFQNEINRQKYARRWIWELIQNARDSKKEGVYISVLLDENEHTLSFSHDGKYFNRLSLLRLITQISDKIEGEDNTGRFGTGFITTNLLSKIIFIKGPYTRGDGVNSQFEFVLDRSAWQMDQKTSEFVHEFKQQIQAAITNLDRLENSQICSVTDELTYFSYPIRDNEALKNVKIGMLDLERQLPLVMAFNPSIKSVKVNSEDYLCFEIDPERLNDNIQLSRFQVLKNSKSFKSILVFADAETKSQVAFYATDKQLENYPEQTPRLFSRFPMVGTECFGLPMVFNSEFFEVTETRDALIDDHPQNLKLLNIAVKLYQFALNYFIQQGYQGYKYICKIEKIGMPLMSKSFADITKQFYSDKPIVNTFRGEMKTLKSVRIPIIRQDEFPKVMPNQSKDELFRNFYNLVSICPNIEIPIYHDCTEWFQIYPESKITVEELGAMINNSPSLLSPMKQTWVNWLNQYIQLLTLLNKKDYLRDNAIYVNQIMNVAPLNGNYKDCIQNEKLKEIYNQVYYPDNKDSIQRRLIFKGLNLNYPIFTDILSCEDDKTIAVKIAQKVAEQQVLSKKNGILDPAIQKAFYELFYWMNSNEALAAMLFPATFNDRMSLCSPSEQIEHYNFGIQTKQDLEKHGASSVDDLIQKIKGKYSTYVDTCLLEIQKETSDVLSNKPEEIDENSIIRLLQRNAIQNEQELVWLLHASNYSAEAIQTFLQYRRSSLESAYELVKAMLSMAANRIFEHLRTKPEIYDLSNAKKIAPTVYDGIIKNGQEICIIARPSNNSKVILYYDSEPDYLRKNYELWIVDTNNTMEVPRILTFGDMIKITGIRVIPLKNLFE